MVWRGSERFGLGEAGQANGKFYVVGAYDPRGNMVGGYEANVQKPSKSYFRFSLGRGFRPFQDVIFTFQAYCKK